KCTHLDCNVQYVPDTKQFFCACHNGYFDDKGVNVAGPPPRPLPAFDMNKDGDVLVLSYREEKTEKV
ncbi:MAG: Rieske 2Fe-2S domain-containing protein, partial [Pseudomonadota bacterium]